MEKKWEGTLPFATVEDKAETLVLNSYAQVLGDELFGWIDVYYAQLAPEILKSNSDATTVKQKMSEGYLKHWLHFESSGKVHGLACLCYDASNLGGHRVYIRHLSTIQPDLMADALD